MIENHYIKNKKLECFEKLHNEIESILYEVIPDTYLVTKAAIRDKVLVYLDKKASDPEESKIKLSKLRSSFSPKDVTNVVDDLTKRGFLKELIGVQIEKLIGARR